MNKVCQTYEEARDALRAGELQAWDGQRWMDIPEGQSVLFGRDPQDYRRKPTAEVSPYVVWDDPLDKAQCFSTARDVAMYLWGKDLKEVHVFKRVAIQSLDIKRIEEQLENT